jgi:hypothetical protein
MNFNRLFAAAAIDFLIALLNPDTRRIFAVRRVGKANPLAVGKTNDLFAIGAIFRSHIRFFVLVVQNCFD